MTHATIIEFLHGCEGVARHLAEALSQCPERAFPEARVQPSRVLPPLSPAPMPPLPPSPATAAASSSGVKLSPDDVTQYCHRVEMQRSAAVLLRAICHRAGWRVGLAVEYAGAEVWGRELGLSRATAYRAQAALCDLGVIHIASNGGQQTVSLRPMRSWLPAMSRA